MNNIFLLSVFFFYFLDGIGVSSCVSSVRGAGSIPTADYVSGVKYCINWLNVGAEIASE